MQLFKGAATALLTPFTSDGLTVDFDTLKLQINWQIQSGISALIIAGTTGEAVALSDKEHQAIIRFTVDAVNGRVPVIAGTGSNNTSDTIEMTAFAERAGVDAALIVNPYYNKTTQAGLIAHFTAIHEQTRIPIVLYNVPSRTGMNIIPQTVATLSQLQRIVAIKEASNDFSQITEIKRLVTDDFGLYSGNDDTIVPFMALGGSGVISVASNIIPEGIVAITDHYLRGDFTEALRLQLKYKPLIDGLFAETNPGPAKFATSWMQRDLGPLRLPMVAVASKTEDRIVALLKDLDLPTGW